MALLDPPTTARSALPYQPALDGLRGLAVAAVIAYHLGLDWAPRGGAVGVTLFFSLSGYLITTLLLRELDRAGRVRLGAFYARRALRLFPALILVVVAVAGYVRWLAPASASHDLSGLAWVLGYVGNWHRAIYGFNSLTLLDHTWTLAVEEQFYLLWPPLLLLAAHRSRRLLLTVAVVGAVAPMVIRLLLWDGLESAARVLNGTDTAADPLMMGCVLAIVLSRASGERLARLSAVARVAVWPAALLLLADALLRLDQNDVPTGVTITLLWGPLALGLASTVVVAHAALRPPRWLALAWLRGIGIISYGLYVWHYPIIRALDEQRPGALSVAEQVLAVGLTLLVAGLSYALVERPFLSLKRRFPAAEPVSAQTLSRQ
jgi:peptidoglycan/LPS O-acetylase OafA/YrhL